MFAAQPMVAVVIPACNEGRRVGTVIATLPQRLPGVDRIVPIVVDDGSSDDTAGVAEAAGAIVLRHRVNLGKGAALTTGCESALRIGASHMVLMDADGQHHAGDLPRLLQPLLEGAADVALAARDFAGHMPPVMRLGNRLLSASLRALFGVSASDSQCGYRALTAAAYQRVRWNATDYAVESEMLVRAGRAALVIAEVPIGTIYLDRHKGTQPLDGLKILRQILAWRLGV